MEQYSRNIGKRLKRLEFRLSDCLPIELVEEIFKQYAYERDYTQSVLQPTLAAIAQVTANLLFRDIYISSATALTSLSHLALRVQSFYFPNVSISLESVIMPAKPFCRPDDVTRDLDAVYRVCSNLHSRDIQFKGTKALLEIEDHRMLTCLPFTATDLHQLTRLEISLRDCEQRLEKVLFSPSFVFPALEELTLSVVVSYSPLHVNRLSCAADCPHDPVALFQAPRLRHLCIRSWTHRHGIRLPTGVRALRSLDIIDADFDDAFWNRLRHFASSLESLVLTSPVYAYPASPTGGSNDPGAVLSSFTSLTALCVPMSTFASWNSFTTVFVLPPCLRRLTLTGCPYRRFYAEEEVFERTQAALRGLFVFKRCGRLLGELRSVRICARRTADSDVDMSASLFRIDEETGAAARQAGVEVLGVVVEKKPMLRNLASAPGRHFAMLSGVSL
ncbi:hypothetical protein DFH11DRAFT_1598034 [Phellopilus nigrolimitatus]|nr:hypothetical protein DFH11DRAFT_1598034 [Phellopilus nigrolimitatus]